MRSPDLFSAPVDDELVMMDAESGTFYALDDIGRFVWTRLSGPMVVADLLADIQEQYEVAPEQCEMDVLALLKHMHDSRLIRVGD